MTRSTVLALLVLLGAPVAQAQLSVLPDPVRAGGDAGPALGAAVTVGENATTAVRRPEFGTKDLVQHRVGATEFSPEKSSMSYATAINGRYRVSGDGSFFAQPRLPAGALLKSWELDYCDFSEQSAVVLNLFDCSWMGDDCQHLDRVFSPDGLPGCGAEVRDLSSLNHTVDNDSRYLVLQAHTGAGDATTRLVGAFIGYKLQVSPAPATPTFSDVPTTHPFFRAIEALVASGVTSGCGGGHFCPERLVTRAEVAKLLANALGLHFPN